MENISITYETVDNIVGKKLKIRTTVYDIVSFSDEIKKICEEFNKPFVFIQKIVTAQYFIDCLDYVRQNSALILTKEKLVEQAKDITIDIFVCFEDEEMLPLIQDKILENEFYKKLKEQ